MRGLLGKASLAADTNTTVYTVPSGKYSTANVLVVNRTTKDTKVRIAITFSTGRISFADYIEYGATVPANGVLERTGLVLSAGEKVRVWADRGTCSYRVHGFEETA